MKVPHEVYLQYLVTISSGLLAGTKSYADYPKDLATKSNEILSVLLHSVPDASPLLLGLAPTEFKNFMGTGPITRE